MPTINNNKKNNFYLFFMLNINYELEYLCNILAYLFFKLKKFHFSELFIWLNNVYTLLYDA